MGKYIKKKYRRIPTSSKEIRMMKVAKRIVEAGGTPLNMGATMLEAGYSPATATNPQKIIRSKTFQELLKDMIPPDMAINKHSELLNAQVKTFVKGDLVTERIDAEAIKGGLDMYYKLTGAYAPEKSIVLNLYADKDDNEIREEIKRLEQEMGLYRDGHIFLEPEVVNID